MFSRDSTTGLPGSARKRAVTQLHNDTPKSSHSDQPGKKKNSPTRAFVRKLSPHSVIYISNQSGGSSSAFKNQPTPHPHNPSLSPPPFLPSSLSLLFSSPFAVVPPSIGRHSTFDENFRFPSNKYFLKGFI
ncbi:uncharacterized protein LAJ45_00581 [Morchella importuna]|uniref:uncharacterized protein n=1 Tax=Morchella importuna TaxID=1174673 RepID=UPI001E8E71D9|nr:uncharacterized protein LAJ45_00581 [Morchella importuna]KAH8155571.1 hypothetical protein LAJ45_00581 [Morchella importuna]